jgi:hypothetical protein
MGESYSNKKLRLLQRRDWDETMQCNRIYRIRKKTLINSARGRRRMKKKQERHKERVLFQKKAEATAAPRLALNSGARLNM